MKDDPKPITGKQLKSFFKAKGVGKNCPACGAEGSMATPVVSQVTESDEILAAAPAVRVVQTLYENTSLGYGQYCQACANCGHLRYFRDIEVLAFFEGDNHNG